METKPPKIPTVSTVCVEHTVVHATKGDGMFQIMTLELVMKQQSVVLSYSIVVKLSGTDLGRLDKVWNNWSLVLFYWLPLNFPAYQLRQLESEKKHWRSIYWADILHGRWAGNLTFLDSCRNLTTLGTRWWWASSLQPRLNNSSGYKTCLQHVHYITLYIITQVVTCLQHVCM